MVVVAVKCKRGPSAPAAAKKSKGKSAGRSLTEACQEEGQLEGDAGEGIHSRWGVVSSLLLPAFGWGALVQGGLMWRGARVLVEQLEEE